MGESILNKKLFIALKSCVGTHRPLGGESVTGCKWDGGLIFQFGAIWRGTDT